MTPSWRKPAGMFLLIAVIALWVVMIASLSPAIGGWPALVQAAFYLVTGIIWILPLGPLLKWMETGHWR